MFKQTCSKGRSDPGACELRVPSYCDRVDPSLLLFLDVSMSTAFVFLLGNNDHRAFLLKCLIRVGSDFLYF